MALSYVIILSIFWGWQKSETMVVMTAFGFTRRPEKNQILSVLLYNFLKLRHNAKNGGDNKKMSGIWEWLKGVIGKHEAAMHSCIHSVRSVFGCSWRDWNLGHMESFWEWSRKVGSVLVLLWHSGQGEVNVPEGLTNLKWVSVNEATVKEGELCQSRRPRSCPSAASSSSSALLLIPCSKFLGNELFW